MFLLLTTLTTAQAGDFVDVWITTAIEDTNLRAGPEDYSPAPNFVARGNRTFFEDYEAAYSDDITQGHLVLYRADDGFWDGWFTEAAMVLQFQPYLDPDETDDGVDLKDDGSYVRVGRELGEGDISLTGYAVDASRFRLGYSYDLSYGGKEIMARSVGAMPGLRLQLQQPKWYAFAGAKSAIGQRTYGQDCTAVGAASEEDEDGCSETLGDRNSAYYGLLFGAGTNIGGKLKLEAGYGLFQQGQLENVPDASSPLYGELIVANGYSGQVAFRTTEDLDFIQSSELRLYRNAPDFVKDTYISHHQLDGFGLLVQAEVDALVHNLLDADNTGTTTLEWGLAGDVQSLAVFGATTVGVDLVYKDLAYILFNVPGLTSGVSIPTDMEVTPQLYGRLKVSHYLEKARLAPSAGVGLMQPASYTTDQGTFVQYTERDKEGVPAGQEATPILGAIVGAQLDLSKSMVTVAEVLYTADPNLSEVVYADDGGTTRVSESTNVQNALGFNLMLRARF